jgi:hypothetical protein
MAPRHCCRPKLETLQDRILPTIASLPAYPITGSGPTDIVAADLNHDGKLDLLTMGTRINVLLGAGNGTFSPGRSFVAPRASAPFAVGDFTGDGKPDLVVGTSTGVAVYPGKGDGTFGRAVYTVTGHAPDSLVLGDFNGDGKLDIAYGYSTPFKGLGTGTISVPAGVAILLGKGNGTFGPAHLAGPAAVVTGVAMTGDLNHDGKLDLIATGPGGINVLLGKGTGAFAPPKLVDGLQTNGTTDTPDALADLNGNGNLDLIVDRFDGKIGTLLGNGKGGFAAPRYLYSGAGAVYGIAVGDFNGDHIPDIAAVTNLGVSELLGQGKGTFNGPHTFATGSDPFDLVAGHFTHSGRADLAVADFGSRDVSILLAGPGGVFRGPSQTTVAGGNVPNAVAVGDFNGDHKNDLVVTNSASGSFTLLMSSGNGQFRSHKIAVPGDLVSGATVADFNGDGKLDVAVIVALPADNDGVVVLLGNGDGTFGAPQTFAVDPGATSLIAADVNGDGKKDLVVGTLAGVDVLMGKGDGTFGPAQALPVGQGLVAAADLDGDGKDDLIVWSGGQGVDVYMGGASGLSGPTALALPGQVSAILTGDFNGDGKQDLAVALQDKNEVAILLGKGHGSFAAPTFWDIGDGPVSLAWGDFTGDGKGDLAIATQSGMNVTVLPGKGNGKFANPIHVLGGTWPALAAAADLDGNAKMDLIVANLDGDIVPLLNK